MCYIIERLQNGLQSERQPEKIGLYAKNLAE